MQEFTVRVRTRDARHAAQIYADLKAYLGRHGVEVAAAGFDPPLEGWVADDVMRQDLHHEPRRSLKEPDPPQEPGESEDEYGRRLDRLRAAQQEAQKDASTEVAESPVVKLGRVFGRSLADPEAQVAGEAMEQG